MAINEKEFQLTKEDIDHDVIDVGIPKEPRRNNSVIDLEKVLTMRQRGFSLSEIGKVLGKSKQSISQYLKRQGVDIEDI